MNQGYYGGGPPGPPGPPHQQSHSPYPPQGGYPQQGGYPPPQQPYGGQPGYHQGPPPGPPGPPGPGYQQGYGPGPGPGYPPPGGAPFPPQGSPYPQQHAPYGQPPPPGGQFGPGPGAAPYGGMPPSMGPPAQPSPGYVPGQQSRMDMSRAADELRRAMKGFGTDEKLLIQTLAPLGPLEINSVKAAFQAKHRRDLVKDIHSETSGYFREGLEGIARGPLEQDCHVLHEAISGLGTKESAMNEVLLSRSNADLNAIKQHYHHKYGRRLETDVKGDLSLKTEQMFDIIMSARRAEESAPIDPREVERDVQSIYHATEGRAGTDQMVVCQMTSLRSNGQLRAIAQAYHQRFHHSLAECVRREFSGHMEDAILYQISAAEDPAKHDADLLEESMAGMGTKDQALVRRIVMIHWNPDRLHQCKAAYKHFYKRELADRIRGETRGDYEKLMLACIGTPMGYGR